jgi:hypothetical protein
MAAMSRFPLAAALLTLTACVAEPTPIGPLSALEIRARLAERTIVATSDAGHVYFIRFERTDRALVTDDGATYRHWLADERGLCLQQPDAIEICAPVYQLNTAHFRWGDTVLGDLALPPPDRPLFPQRPFQALPFRSP